METSPWPNKTSTYKVITIRFDELSTEVNITCFYDILKSPKMLLFIRRGVMLLV